MFERQFVSGTGEPAVESASPDGSLGAEGSDTASADLVASAAEPTSCPGAANERRVTEATERARAAAAAVTLAQAELVDAVAALRELEGQYLATPRQWVSWQCGLTRAETRHLVDLAEKLPSLPLLDAAFRRGQLSTGVVATMVSVATPENEHVLLDATRDATGAQLETVVRDFRRARRKRNGRPHDEDPSIARSKVSAGWDDHGRFRGKFDLRADDGAVAEAALQGALGEHRVDEATIDGAPASTSVTDGEPRADEKAPRTTMADAFMDVCAAWLGRHTDDDGRLAEPFQTIIHHEPDADDPTGWVDRICDAGAIDRRLAEMLSCESTLVDQVMVAGFPVNEPRRARLFNRLQRRAMTARDRHCRYPGCPRSRNLHAHHVDDFVRTKRTAVNGGVMLCGYHHWYVHHHHLRLSLENDHTVLIQRRDGTTLRGAPIPPPSVDEVERPPHPPPDRRRTGCGEGLTIDARDCYLDALDRVTPESE